MMNARTWQRLMLSAMIMFPAALASVFLPPDSPWTLPLDIAVLWGIAVAILGAAFGVMMGFGKLRFGCPKCNTPCEIHAAYRNKIAMDCPQCGPFRISPFGVKADTPPQ